eukprot:EG_transcript_23400
MKRRATEYFPPKETSWDQLTVAGGQRRATAPVSSASHLRSPAILIPLSSDPTMTDASTDVLFGDVIPPGQALPKRGSVFGEISKQQPSSEAGPGWKLTVSRPPPPPLSEMQEPSPAMGCHGDYSYSPMQAMLSYKFGSTAPPSSTSSCQASPSGILKSGHSPMFPAGLSIQGDSFDDSSAQREGRPPATPGKVRRVSILDSAEVAEG